MDARSKLVNWWAQTGADIATSPVSLEKIDAIERRYALRLPEDFRDYLAMGAPVADNLDREIGHWWPVDRIGNLLDEYPQAVPFIPNEGRKTLFFLDHCLWCWAWAISCEEGATFGRVALIGGAQDRFVADTFADFVDRYIGDWTSVS